MAAELVAIIPPRTGLECCLVARPAEEVVANDRSPDGQGKRSAECWVALVLGSGDPCTFPLRLADLLDLRRDLLNAVPRQFRQLAQLLTAPIGEAAAHVF